MGFLSFLRKIFGNEAEEAELDAARARHGITVDKIEANKPTTEQQKFADDYDVWEELRNMRASFFIGGWASKKFRVFGEEKVKKQLADLEKKRQEEEGKKGE